ncbi:uracil-DNA glycosylase [Fistulifera solaris]|uniref:Uracil-DNA glycosylase n=1 Tax=Fistulifera solaris TaxID=1519565 RepID=A0A1Z5JBV4_FISSO|nr:uracil-DNA glycosylase [Fistulifera solaris]|eukprot:GAX11494.1 uracil-DNA glycosylase [Fistulifera solaris]
MIFGFSRHVASWSQTLTKSSFTQSMRLSFVQRRTLASYRKSQIFMMPEGPEVRTLVDQLQGGVGKRLVNIQVLSGRYRQNGPPDGFVEFASTITRYVPGDDEVDNVDIIQEWNCKGKFIYIVLDDGKQEHQDPNFQRTIFVTLGMTGKFVAEKVHRQDSRFARWSMELLDVNTMKTIKIFYHDQRNFGTLKFCLKRADLQEKLDSLGPDILDNYITDQMFLDIVAAQKQDLNICKFLMNQTKISGVGNYILAEALYRARIDPFASLHEINESQLKSLFREIRTTALQSYQANGLTRQNGGQYNNMDGEAGRFSFELQCYGKETCAKGKPVLRETNGPHDRTIWYTEDQLFMPRDLRMTESAQSFQRDDSSSEQMEETDSVGLSDGLTEPSWRNVLAETFETESFRALEAFLEDERRQGATVYPPPQDIFSALNSCPFDQVKVVIVGQDPYHGPGQGNGMAFSVRSGIQPPPSLQNIFREAMSDVGIAQPLHGNLQCWARQGILLLNSVLTVRQGEANSHANKGWEEFTDLIIRRLNDDRENLVFLLWGRPAATKAKCVDEGRHHVIRTSHPSPLGATKTTSPFLSSKCFSRCNEYLTSVGNAPIDWSVV